MKPRKISVFVWRDGRVDFGLKCPDEALPIATGPEDELRGVVEVLAVRGNDGVLRISGVNVTGEAINIPAKTTVKFSAGKELKDALKD